MGRKPKQPSPIKEEEVPTVTVEQLALLFSCDVRTIRNYITRGLVIKVGHGQYALFPSITNVVKYLRELASGRLGRSSDVDPAAESALLKRANRMKVEQEVRRAEGQLISVAEVKEAGVEIARAVRGMVMSWPGRVSFELPHLTPQDKEVMRRCSEETLRMNSLLNPETMLLPKSHPEAQ